MIIIIKTIFGYTKKSFCLGRGGGQIFFGMATYGEVFLLTQKIIMLTENGTFFCFRGVSRVEILFFWATQIDLELFKSQQNMATLFFSRPSYIYLFIYNF